MIIRSFLAVLIGACSLSAVTTQTAAQTVTNVTQISYDVHNRPICTTTRMNPAIYGALPSDACTLGSGGTFGPDRITKNTYDTAGQLTEVDQAFGTSVQRAYARYSYNPDGTKATEMDANGNKTAYVYDSFDRLSQVQYPSKTVGSGGINTADYDQYTYDANSNKASWRRRNGFTIAYTYDALNRETFQDLPASPGNANGTDKDLSTTYDLLGHIKTKRFGNGLMVSYTYDNLGRLSAASDVLNRVTFYQYNQASALTYLTMPDGTWVNYVLDNTNRMTSVNHSSAGILFTQSYDSLGRRAVIGKGLASTAFGYDNLGRLTSMGDSFTNSSYSTSWGFSYNPASQIVSTSASSTVFDYKETTSSTTNNAYNGLNQDAGIAALSGGFDADANLTNDGTRTMVYDLYNRLLSVNGTSANLQFDYDPEGRLYKYTSNGTPTYFNYDGTKLIGEYSATGTLRQYIHGSGVDEPVVWFEGSGTSDRRYFIQNYQGSIIAYTNASGTVNPANIYKYGPYGEPKDYYNNDSWSGSRFRYTGQTMLSEAHLYYYKARVYDPVFGRFLQTDPIGSKDDLDLYAYTGDDPVNRADPSGNQAFEPIPNAAAAEAEAAAARAAEEEGAAARGARFVQAPPSQLPGTQVSEPVKPITGKSDYDSRRSAFAAARLDARIPSTQQPDQVGKEILRDARSGKPVLDANGQPVYTREYKYTRSDGSGVVIQEHSDGHDFGGKGDQGPHFNVRPEENTKTGSVRGTHDHYSYRKNDSE